MKREWIAVGLIALAGCSGQEAAAPVEEDAPVVMKAGQWTLTRTTTGYNTPTVTPAEYQAHVGKKSEESVCLKVDADDRPDPNALAGAEGTECSYKSDSLFRKGRMIATLECKAGTGTSQLPVEGNYTADTLTLGVSMTKSESGSPVLRTTHDLSGKRTGDCKPE